MHVGMGLMGEQCTKSIHAAFNGSGSEVEKPHERALHTTSLPSLSG